MKQAVENEII